MSLPCQPVGALTPVPPTPKRPAFAWFLAKALAKRLMPVWVGAGGGVLLLLVYFPLAYLGRWVEAGIFHRDTASTTFEFALEGLTFLVWAAIVAALFGGFVVLTCLRVGRALAKMWRAAYAEAKTESEK